MNHPYFSNSMRVFFPWVALIAVLVPMYTVTVIVNGYPFKNSLFNVFEWHAFEMLFGFFYTLIISFLLTAAADWNNKKPLSGIPLLILFLFWILEQIFLFQSQHIIFLILTTNILAVLSLFFLNEALNQHKEKYKILVFVFLLSLCKNIFFIEKSLSYDSTMLILSIASILVMTRIIPQHTKQHIVNEDLEVPNWLINSSQFFLFLLPLTIFFENTFIKGSLFVSVGILQLPKLLYWKTWKSVKISLIGMVHMSFFIINSGLIIKGLSYYFSNLENTKATLHLILMGGIAILALNLMTRATLEFEGRKIHSGKRINAMYFFIVLGMFIRFIVPVFYPEYFIKSLHHSMGHWTMAFLIYLVGFSHLCFIKLNSR